MTLWFIARCIAVVKGDCLVFRGMLCVVVNGSKRAIEARFGRRWQAKDCARYVNANFEVTAQ
jgi:hypothetical protein